MLISVFPSNQADWRWRSSWPQVSLFLFVLIQELPFGFLSVLVNFPFKEESLNFDGFTQKESAPSPCSLFFDPIAGIFASRFFTQGSQLRALEFLTLRIYLTYLPAVALTNCIGKKMPAGGFLFETKKKQKVLGAFNSLFR
jgi:hypothetical protein